ncbi:GntR family transcriptional regulator [Williamsia sp. 1135]|uniref:GntR family transcriptional regulator n=1 Tax=Williamsia sp. 1135 TaxID=1889262 RepID=UPI0014398CD3|nr:GntR family transcriptional regulator [Williamsia sp. 1135]
MKHRLIANELAGRIRRGEFGNRERLPGEMVLADEFAVSRGTVRQALTTLQREGLIETWTGAGSFVTYDGEEIDDGFGWTKALRRKGIYTSLDLMALGRVELPVVARRLSLTKDHFLLVERVRKTSDDQPITLERSYIPWRSSLETVIATGLVDGSIKETLAQHGMLATAGEESIGVAILGSHDAEMLGRPAGDAFLETEQTNYDMHGQVVEFVRSLLHPQHFRLHHSFGGHR